MIIMSVERSFVLGECEFSRSRWWSGHSKSVVFLFILTMMLSYVSPDDPSTKQWDSYSEKHYADVHILFTGKETRKELLYLGSYGKQSLLTEVSGVVMHAMSLSIPSNTSGKSSVVTHYGCTNYINEKFPSERWIALVERGECPFATKITVATKVHNASAIAIYNDDDIINSRMIMNHKEAPNSTAVFLHKSDGEAIVQFIERGYTVYMRLSPGINEDHTFRTPYCINKSSVPFVSIFFIVLMIISLVGVTGFM